MGITKTQLVNTVEQVKNYVDNKSLDLPEDSKFVIDSTPVGTIISYMGITPPKDYLLCDGSELEISKYSELAEFILKEFSSYNYFGGDGVDTFAVPDLRGEFLRGTGTNSHENQGSGANVGIHQDATSQLNTFIPGGSTNFSYPGNAAISNDIIAQNIDSTVFDVTANRYVTTSKGTTTYAEQLYYTARSTNTSVNYCIKCKTSFNNAGQLELANYSNINSNYSLDEKVIGCWIDGKPLYQKTISCGGLKNNTSLTISHNVTNIDTIINWSGCGINSSDGLSISLPYVYYSDVDTIGVYCNKSSITIMTHSDQTMYNTSYITIQYTKTTDAENSYISTDSPSYGLTEEEEQKILDDIFLSEGGTDDDSNGTGCSGSTQWILL